jgi:hypothetical protein
VSLVAGIDYSTHAIDVVLIDEDTLKPEWYRYELRGQDSFDRARDVHRALRSSVLGDELVLAAGIEQPRGYGAGHLYRIQGATLQRLPSRTLVQPWVPSEWRKAVGLQGNAGKYAIRWFVHDVADVPDNWPQDACDAFCIARATLQALERSTTDA